MYLQNEIHGWNTTEKIKSKSFCAKAHIVTHVNNENIVIYYQIFLMNLVIVFHGGTNALCFLSLLFVSSIVVTSSSHFKPKESGKVLSHQPG